MGCGLDGNHATCAVHLHLLRQGRSQSYAHASDLTLHLSGCREAHECRDLEMSCLQEGNCWGGMDGLNDCSSHGAKVGPPFSIPSNETYQRSIALCVD